MKLLRLCFGNIKSFFLKRFVIAIVLILGIVISASALNVYYAQNLALSHTVSGYTSVDKSVDFIAQPMVADDYREAADYLCAYENDLDFYSVMSTELSDVDIIGIQAQTNKIGIEVGEWVKGNGEIVVPYEIDGKSVSVGDKYTLMGKEYTVCGIYGPGAYAADQYSSRRITKADYASAGVDGITKVNEDDPYDFSDREAYGVFITYSDFAQNGYSGEILRVKFSDFKSDSQKDKFSEDFINDLFNANGTVINPEIEAMEKAGEVYGVQFISKFLVYIIISLLSLINIMALFTYIIKCRKREFLLFKNMGATDGKLLIATALECSIYIITAYTAGFLISKFIIKHSDLRDTVPYYGLKQYAMLLAIMLIVSLVYVLLSQKVLLKEHEETEHLLDMRAFLSKTHFKRIYLVLKNYSSGILSEVIIFLQVMMVAFSFTYVATFYFNRGANKRIDDNITYGQTTYIYEWNSIVMSSLPFPSYWSNDIKSPIAEETLEQIKSLEGLKGFGSNNIAEAYLNIDHQKENIGSTEHTSVFYLRFISPAMIENLNMKVAQGVWLDEWANGVDLNELGYIPIVVSQSTAKQLNIKCGDILSDNGLFANREYWHDIEVDAGNGQTEWCWDFSADPNLFSVKVVGVLDDNSRFFSAQQGPPTVETVFPTVKEYSLEGGLGIVYCPYVYCNGEMLWDEGIYDGQTILFPDGTKTIEYYREKLEPYGAVYSLEELAARDDGYYLTGTTEYEIHFYVTVALLIIGVVGYNLLSIERNKRTYGVYFSCGMPMNRAVTISMSANMVIFVLGGIIGSLWGIISADSTRHMAYETKCLSLSASIAFILVLFLLSSILMFIQMSKLSPSNIMRKDK